MSTFRGASHKALDKYDALYDCLYAIRVVAYEQLAAERDRYVRAFSVDLDLPNVTAFYDVAAAPAAQHAVLLTPTCWMLKVKGRQAN